MNNIVGIILLKCGENKEREVCEFSEELFEENRVGRPCGNDCVLRRKEFLPFMHRRDGTKRRRLPAPCTKLDFQSFSTFTGFFDFFLVVSAARMKDIEDFVIYCLRGGSKRLEGCVEATQTVIGSMIHSKE